MDRAQLNAFCILSVQLLYSVFQIGSCCSSLQLEVTSSLKWIHTHEQLKANGGVPALDEDLKRPQVQKDYSLRLSNPKYIIPSKPMLSHLNLEVCRN